MYQPKSNMNCKLPLGALQGDQTATFGGDTIDLGWCETNNKDGENHY